VELGARFFVYEGLVRRLVLASMLVACSRSTPELTSDPPATEAVHAQSTPLAPTTSAVASSPASLEPWNPHQIDWQPFDEGLARAKKQHKPVCLVLYTTWCPHCRNYSRVFADPRLVDRAKDFVMIRLDADQNEAIARRYQPDGGYVPRTFILDADGNVDPAGVSGNPRYQHFFDERRADSLLQAMAASHPRAARND
jgi:thiol-disulfide isomerase/thioredoxin